MSPPVLTLDFHPSVREEELRRASLAALRSNRIDPKSLYTTARQANLWRQVFLRHSPVNGNPEFVRIYQEAFAQTATMISARKIHLVGLGCGTGAKEQALQSALKAGGKDSVFTAIDVSHALVLESVEKLVAAGASHQCSLVCDLAEATFLGDWLSHQNSDLPRLYTFFGLVPNIAPSEVLRLFQALLRPCDLLLVSAHLAPVNGDSEDDLAAAMSEVLPQYRNPETLAWLTAGIERQGIEERVCPPEMVVGEREGIPAFLGQARWKSSDAFELEGEWIQPGAMEPLLVFSSLRYTPALFEKVLLQGGFQARQLAITSCRQEAIWCIQRG